MNESKRTYRESTLWQRRFWEHQIRDDDDAFISSRLNMDMRNAWLIGAIRRFIVMCERVFMRLIGVAGADMAKVEYD